MSSGYATRLSEYPNKGVCGLPEMSESSRTLTLKISTLMKLIEESKYIVVLTGAGISTSAGIPDFRGPQGIWTLEKREKLMALSRKKRKISGAKSCTTATRTISSESASKDCFSTAGPTLTHRAISKLASLNIIQYCITQNVDGLHRRSGLPRDKHSVLHGCVFTEKCEKCGVEYFRDFDIGGVRCQKTGRSCEECGGDLRDTVLDWEDELPEPDYGFSQDHCGRSDLVICLGTSLRIEPAGSLPLLAKKYVIVNMQATPKDDDAELLIRAKVDYVMKEILCRLGVD